MVGVSLLAVTLIVVEAGSQPDACAATLPKSLKSFASRQLAGYRLPKQSDNSEEDIQQHLQHGGNGCLGVATGDFDGDGKKDVAFLATSKVDVWLIVAFHKSRGWHINRVYNMGGAELRGRLYVDRVPPGTYDDIGLAEKPELGQVETFTSKTDVILTGMTEATGIAFWKAPKGWVHVWISD